MTAKIFRYAFALGVVILILCGFLFFGLQFNHAKDETYEALQQQAVFASSGVMIAGEDYLSSIGGEEHITWIASDGSVKYDSMVGASAVNQLDYPEVTEALENGEGYNIRASENGDSNTMYYALRCSDGTVIRLSSPINPLKTALVAISPIFWMIVFVLLLSGFFAFRAAKQITAPINDIKVDSLEKTTVYPEISPLVDKIREQNLTISDQMAELQRRQREFSTLTDNMSEGFILTDRQGIVLSVNNSANKMISGCSIGDNIAESDDSPVADLIRSALNGERAETVIEEAGRSKQIVANPILSRGAISGVAVLAVDVTETAQRERLRREFSANVSHELKTPLTSISGFAELMMQDLVPPEKSKEFAADIYNQSQRLMMLIDDIIKISKLDEQNSLVETEEIDLFELSSTVLSSLESYAASRNVQLSVEGDHAVILGSESFIDEMIYNLCDNAIKYNKENGSVVVTVRDGEDTVQLSVKDTGVGIPFEHQDRVFERFFRADNFQSQELSGTGLGLSIVKHAAQIHNAKIQMNSKPDEGTEIIVTFPKESKGS